MKAIFDSKPGSGYDDDIQTRYHFPNQYLEAAINALNDWIVYRSTRRGGGRIGYFAAARVVSVEADSTLADHSYARVSDFLQFDNLVPLERKTGGFYETQLDFLPQRSSIGRTLQGHSVRNITDIEFGHIVRAGLKETLAPSNVVKLELDPTHVDPETLSLVNAPEDEQARRVVQILMNRKVRDVELVKIVQ